MSDRRNHAEQHDWLSDCIVSVTQGPDAERDGARVRMNKDPFLRLQFITIYVRDQGRGLRFFVDQLGFRLISDVRFASGRRWVEVSPPDGTASLALVLPDPSNPHDRQPEGSSPVTFVTEDIHAKYSQLCERGVKFTVPCRSPPGAASFAALRTPMEILSSSPASTRSRSK